jgi:hypothetical protein
MFTLNIDLGQILIATLIAIVGWFVKTAVNRVYVTLDRHDEQINDIIARVEHLLGKFERDSK